MADDKSKIDKGIASRLRVVRATRYLMQKTNITAEQARDLIKRFGNDRVLLEREAKKLG